MDEWMDGWMDGCLYIGVNIIINYANIKKNICVKDACIHALFRIFLGFIPLVQSVKLMLN